MLGLSENIMRGVDTIIGIKESDNDLVSYNI